MFNKVFTSMVFSCFVMAIIASLILPILTKPAFADYVEDLREKPADIAKTQEGSVPPYVINPVIKMRLESFYYSDYQDKTYCFDNSEGRCLDKEYNLFTTIEGKGELKDRFYVYYKTELNQDGNFKLKKAYVLLKTGIWSWEVGKDTIWMGPGYHGSLLLSNNAEGFPLVRIRTEDPFRFPWLFSHLGEFKYDLFRGWSDNSSLMGQRLSWRPVSLLEFGANQIVYIQPGKHYQVYEYPRVLFSSSDNSGNQMNSYNNDQKASLDITLDMPFIGQITPFRNGKIYVEYGGNDSYAIWQKEDRSKMANEPERKKFIWPFMFDFMNIGWLAGVFLTTGDADFRFEYAQNYASYPLFYDVYHGIDRRHGPWYSYINTRDGQIMGHAMGNDADDLFFEFVMRHNPLTVKFDFDRQRHGLNRSGLPPEYRYQYGISPSYQFKAFKLFSDIIYNHYRNVNVSSNPVDFYIQPGTRRDEVIAGFGVEIAL